MRIFLFHVSACSSSVVSPVAGFSASTVLLRLAFKEPRTESERFFFYPVRLYRMLFLLLLILHKNIYNFRHNFQYSLVKRFRGWNLNHLTILTWSFCFRTTALLRFRNFTKDIGITFTALPSKKREGLMLRRRWRSSYLKRFGINVTGFR